MPVEEAEEEYAKKVSNSSRTTRMGIESTCAVINTSSSNARLELNVLYVISSFSLRFK